MPLPPYIDRPDEDSDKERYQTVYNEKPGAVAAPTAGLHFDDEPLLAKMQAKGVEYLPLLPCTLVRVLSSQLKLKKLLTTLCMLNTWK